MAQGWTKEQPVDTDPTLAGDADYIAPSQSAVKAYVDNRISAADAEDLTDGGETALHTHAGGSGMAPGYLPWKHYARLATAGPLPTNTYDNTAGTITGNSTGILTVDGVVVALNDYVLVQSDSTKNGLYKCTTAGAVGVAFVLTRAEDMNEASEFPGATIMVGPEGTGFAAPLIYECTNSSVILGTTSITFNTIQARPIGAAGGELWGLYPSPTILNSAVIAKVLTGFSASAGTVSSSDSILQAFQKVVGNIAQKLTANSPIAGATKTKITYDSNGLVTAGADATTADIADSTNKRYVTDAQLTVIGNTSGTNSGDSATPAETATTIGALIGGAGDATPNDSDFVATSLTAGGILKKITWTNVKAFLKTYFDTLYQFADAELSAIAGLTSAANKVPRFSGSGTAALIDVEFGTWTPTGTTGTNVATVTPNLCHYMRVGDEVFFHGSVQVDTTAVGAFTCYLSIPIASNFNANTDANGNGTQPGAGVPNIISIREDQTNDRLQLDGYAQVNTNLFYRLSGGYIIK